VLFNAPLVHLQALERIWVDRTMCHLPWDQFIEKLKGDWQEFILYATVLLNANVAFLAIPSVDPGNSTQRSATQVASYVSIVTSVASIITGLMLVRQYRVKPRETVEEAANFLASKTHDARGVETLAILYSLPYAFLFWGMVTFLAAFTIENFVTKTRSSIYFTAVVWVLCGCLILWCIYAAWEDETTPLWQRFRENIESKWIVLREYKQEFVKRVLPGTHIVPPPPSQSVLPPSQSMPSIPPQVSDEADSTNIAVEPPSAV